MTTTSQKMVGAVQLVHLVLSEKHGLTVYDRPTWSSSIAAYCCLGVWMQTYAEQR